MYASKEEGDEIDALIDRAEEEAKQAKKKETEEDSDLEIVDPSKSQEEEEGEEQDDDGDEGDWREALRDAEREETPDELLMTQRRSFPFPHSFLITSLLTLSSPFL